MDNTLDSTMTTNTVGGSQSNTVDGLDSIKPISGSDLNNVNVGYVNPELMTYNVIIGCESDFLDNKSQRTVIIGPRNKVQGSFNIVVGSDNQVEGDNNIVFGSNLKVKGDNQKIIQDTELKSYAEGDNIRSYTMYRLISALENVIYSRRF